MNPTPSELLVGNFMALITPPPPESMGEFLAGKVSVTGMISLLMAQEAERGIAVRVEENRAIRALLAEAADGGWAPALSSRLAALGAGEDADLRLAAVDAANAVLRQGLIDLHDTVFAREGPQRAARDRRIVALYVDMAQARRLDLPPLPAR